MREQKGMRGGRRAGAGGRLQGRLGLSGVFLLVGLAIFIGCAEAALAVEQAGPPVRMEQTEPTPETAEIPARTNRAFYGLAGVLTLFLIFQAYLGLSGRKCRIERIAGLLDAAADELDFYRTRLGRIEGEIGAALEGPPGALGDLNPACPFRPEFLERLRIEAALDGGDRKAVRELGECHFELSLIGRDMERLGGDGNHSQEEWRRLRERLETTRRRLQRTGGRIEELAGRHRSRLHRIHYRIARS
ncbi:MAG: hypothetical protein JW958_01825 [Candidatus Eisenbacteria bacterium]|nr:hypothetical protein [Candidatus Eisenbacteria bacterium]